MVTKLNCFVFLQVDTEFPQDDAKERIQSNSPKPRARPGSKVFGAKPREPTWRKRLSNQDRKIISILLKYHIFMAFKAFTSRVGFSIAIYRKIYLFQPFSMAKNLLKLNATTKVEQKQATQIVGRVKKGIYVFFTSNIEIYKNSR